MRYLLTALAMILMIAPQAFAADIETRDLAYARCLMTAYESGLKGGDAQEIYLVACMRVAGYEPDRGALKGGARFQAATAD